MQKSHTGVLAPFSRFSNPKGKERISKPAAMLFSARSLILVISFQAAVIAGILAYLDNKFNALYFIALLAAYIALHMASNLSNDYFGYRHGHDTADSPRRRYTFHPLADNIVSERGLKVWIVMLFAVAVAIAAFFTYARGLLILIFVAIGLALFFLYDASPITLKSIGLGEIAAFVVWGPLMIGGGYFAITGILSLNAFLISLPYGLGVMSILIGKHIDQIEFDRSHGQGTLPVIAGEKAARVLNQVTIVVMYGIAFLLVLSAYAPASLLIILFNIPQAVLALNTLSKPRPKKPPAGYIGWPLWYHRHSLVQNRNFGWLYIIGLLIGAVLLLFKIPVYL
ncbi:MAG: prenyltransferase [Candidatus Micrarchaeaceae archaeon]